MKVRYLRRADWGGTFNSTPLLEKLPDPELYVHHVGGGAWMDGVSAEQAFRNLNAYAQQTKGYQFLDYDALVHYHRGDDVLTIGEGRGVYRSAATLDRNEQGEAVVLCGNTDRRAPLAEELEGLALAIVWMRQQGWATADSQILGHRDNPAHPNATTCPGAYLYPKLPDIRNRVKQITSGKVDPAPAPPPPPAEDGRVLVAHGWYRVRDRQWAANIAEAVLGDAERWPEIAAINRPRDEWYAGSFVAIPDTPSVLVTVRSGEGMWAVIRRALPGVNPAEREAATWAWNGGKHTLKANEVVSVPVFWTAPS